MHRPFVQTSLAKSLCTEGCINFICPLATEQLEGKSNKKVYVHQLFGASEFQVLGSRVSLPLSWAAGDLGWYGPCTCQPYLVHGLCLAMGPQIKVDACWLLLSRRCFVRFVCNMLVLVSSSELSRARGYENKLCTKSVCIFSCP